MSRTTDGACGRPRYRRDAHVGMRCPGSRRGGRSPSYDRGRRRRSLDLGAARTFKLGNVFGSDPELKERSERAPKAVVADRLAQELIDGVVLH